MKQTIYSILFLLLHYTGHAQIITTVVGNGGAVLGDGGPAVNASLDGPYGVALDGHGNMYVTDGYHGRIRKIDAAGIITTIAGTGVEGYNGDNIAATAAQIYRPVGIIIDHTGNILFCDAFNHRVRRIDALGIITTVAGNGIPTYNGDNIAATAAALCDPHCVALDGAGNMYITDYENHRIRKVNAAGIITTVAGTGISGSNGDNGSATDAMINSPYGIALDAAGNIFFADDYANVVRKIDGAGIITTFAGNGTVTSLGDGGPATAASLNHPLGLAIDGINTMYISVASQERIRKVAPDGIITTIAGVGTLGFSGDNSLATSAELASPIGIAIDAVSGTIYFADFYNNRVRRIGWPLGVDELEQKQTKLYIYPNPSTGTFSLSVSSEKQDQFNITVADVTGRIVKEITIEANKPQQIDLSQSPGVYILTAANKTTTLSKRVIIA